MSSSARGGSPSSRPLSKWKLLFVCSFILVLADQGAKFLAVQRLTTAFANADDLSSLEKLGSFYAYRHLERLAREPYEVWGGLCRLRYAENPGSAFGLFVTAPRHLRFVFFTIVTLAAVAFIVVTYRRLREDERPRQVALALVLAGAVGNFVDRMARRYVIDFIDWGLGELRWPTFNLADIFIVVGVGLLLLVGKSRLVSEPGSGDGTRRPARPMV